MKKVEFPVANAIAINVWFVSLLLLMPLLGSTRAEGILMRHGASGVACDDRGKDEDAAILIENGLDLDNEEMVVPEDEEEDDDDTPHCPNLLMPQLKTLPLVDTAVECSVPLETFTKRVSLGRGTREGSLIIQGSKGESGVFSPHCPDILEPHAYTLPSASRAVEKSSPAAI